MIKPPLVFPNTNPKHYFSFDPDHEPVWPDLVTYLEKTKTNTPLYLAEPALSLEPLFYLAARTCHLPAIIAPATNLPLILHIIEQVRPDTFVGQAHLLKIVVTAYSQNHTLESNSVKRCFIFGENNEADIALLSTEYQLEVTTHPSPAMSVHEHE